jgi:hypothetical protein
MSKYFTLEQLAEGIRDRNVGTERAKLVEKWSRTGLLRGLTGKKVEVMAQLLENQAVQVLKESNALSTGGGALTSSGQIQGFSNIAFPIVRRVFGGLVANELVSIQPLSLPSGLIFYLDYTYGSNVGGDAGVGLSNSSANETYTRGQSLYNNPPGRGIQSGSLAAGGQYDLVGTGYSKVHSGSAAVVVTANTIGSWTGASNAFVSGSVVKALTDFTGSNARFANYDPQVENDLDLGNLDYQFVHLSVANLATAITNGNPADVTQVAVTAFGTTGGAKVGGWGEAYQGGTGVLNLRRLNKRGNFSTSTGIFTPDPLNGTHIQAVIAITNAGVQVGSLLSADTTATVSMAIADSVTAGDATGAVVTIPSFESDFGATPSAAIPEIDIKIETISITATTRKLRARWTPELSQDLNAYHSLDAEVELTSILSEQIALEIDREILSDLLTGANGANYYWSRAPGQFVNKVTGQTQALASSLSIGPAFTGTVQDWYQTLVETIIDVANTIHRKTLRGRANFIVTGPDVCTILESSVLYKPKLTIDGEGQVSSPFTIGAEAVGTVSNRFTVYNDPYFVRNRILVGYKGGSYLECGYVYAPYVPLIVTPTIYAPEDMTPRKGVMTRYGRKMIRSDFFGTVTVLNMNLI